MNFLNIARSGTELLVSMGAGAVVGNAIKRSIPASSTLIQKISIGVGGFVISGMVGEMATKYTNENIDKGLAALTQLKEGVHITVEVDDPDEKSVSTDAA